jgi:hypothetical protein
MRSPEQIAFGAARELTCHEVLANWHHRDRAIQEAARLGARIELLAHLPAGGACTLEQRDQKLDALWDKRETLIIEAVVLTMEARGLSVHQWKIVEKEVRQEVDEAPLPEELQRQVNAARKCKTASIKHTLRLIAEKTQKSGHAWLGLIQSQAQDQDITACIEGLVKAQVKLTENDFALMLSEKRVDIIAQLIAKKVINPARFVTEDGEELSLLAYGIKHDLPDDFLKTLIEMDADVRVVVGRGEEAQTIVGVAIKRDWESKLVELLLNAGAPIPRLIDGISPLAVAYGKRRHDLFQILLTRGVATDVVIEGKTLLGKILSEDRELTRILVLEEVYARKPDGTRKAFDQLISLFDLNAPGGDDQTPLHDYCASKLFDREIFLRLAARGGNPGAKNKHGKSVLDLLILHQGSKV